MLFAKFKIFKAYFEMYYIYDSSISTGVVDIGSDKGKRNGQLLLAAFCTTKLFNKSGQ